MLKRSIRNLGKRCIRSLFETGQRLGFDVLPRHFYSEIPSIAELRNSPSWRRPYPLSHVAGAPIDQQIDCFRRICPTGQFDKDPQFAIHAAACKSNGEAGFGPVEANVLHAFVRNVRPKKIVQIGCGVSTAVVLDAAERAEYQPVIYCVEPYPTQFLRSLNSSDRIQLVPVRVQDEIPQVIQLLQDTDFFFVDSTHTLGPAGEVTRIILELLPSVPAGSWAHFHDITFPYDYGRRVLTSELFFSHETSLLLAFLTMNNQFSLRMSLSQLHYSAPQVIAEVIPDYKPAGNEDGTQTSIGHFPSSAYLQRHDKSSAVL